MLFGTRRSHLDDGVDDTDPKSTGGNPWTRFTVWGARVALFATLLQIPIGVWVLIQSPSELQDRLMGGDAIGTILFAASICTAIVLVQLLGTVAFANLSNTDAPDVNIRGATWRATGMLFLVIVLMTGTLQRMHQQRRTDAPHSTSIAAPLR